MSAQFYDNAIRETYRFPAAAVDTAGVFGRFIGPSGKTGRVVNISHIVINDITVAAAVVDVDTNAGLTTPAQHTIPVSSANAGASATPGNVTNGLAAASELPADTVVEVASDGGATAGDADVIVTVDWY